MKDRAFTLIELVFVVAIIAVLAAIAVPNFLEAQVRAKTSRVHQDMASLSSALRSYFADHNRYPPHRPEVQEFLEACSRVEVVSAETTSAPLHTPYPWTDDDPQMHNHMAPAQTTGPFTKDGTYGRYPLLLLAGYDLAALTTPVTYAEVKLPVDPYADRRGAPFVYVNLLDVPTTGTPEWQKPGPFKRFILLSYGPDTDFARPDFVNPVKGPWLPYDPTNGTISAGDIFAFGNYSASYPTSDLKAPVEVQQDLLPI